MVCNCQNCRKQVWNTAQSNTSPPTKGQKTSPSPCEKTSLLEKGNYSSPASSSLWLLRLHGKGQGSSAGFRSCGFLPQQGQLRTRRAKGTARPQPLPSLLTLPQQDTQEAGREIQPGTLLQNKRFKGKLCLIPSFGHWSVVSLNVWNPWGAALSARQTGDQPDSTISSATCSFTALQVTRKAFAKNSSKGLPFSRLPCAIVVSE